MNLLQSKSKEDLNLFLEMCDLTGLDREWAKSKATASLKYYKGNDSARESLREFQELENKWYESLGTGSPFYGVYSEKELVPDIFACWSLYSKRYLKDLQKVEFLTVNRVVDLGCGLGFSTSALKSMFENAEVYGTNVAGTPQYNICLEMSKRFSFTMKEDTKDIGKCDIVFASEYFEHFLEPLEHLKVILETTNPTVLVLANSFSSISVGHFPTYIVYGKEIENRKMTRVFNSYLKNNGFEKASFRFKFWNNRPVIWVQK